MNDVTGSSRSAPPLRPWSPQPGPQADAIAADWCPELLYGGAAGGGKSDFLLGDYLQDVLRYGGAWQGVLFRRTVRELEELLSRAHHLYPATGAKWEATAQRWRWPNAAVLRLRYLDRDADATRYQGHAYTWIGWDELTQWATPFAYRYLRARLRAATPVPTKRIRATANPGGVGHQWVKAMFIDPAPTGYTPIPDPATGTERLFIPSRLHDNRILVAADPGYEGRLRGLGSPELVRAWLDGDWTVVTGAYFPEFSTARHVVPPRPLPRHWTRFRALDWGSAKPFAVLWSAVSDGTDPAFPPGALVVYREWYGMEPGRPDTGLRLPSDAVAAGILARETPDERIAYSVADPRMFGSDDGPSIAERMMRRGVALSRADNARVAGAGAISGWDQLRARLRGEDGVPGLFVFGACTHLIRTLPALQHDPARPEDLDTRGEDHAADALRYGCMSRPYQSPAPKGRRTRDGWADAFCAADGMETWRTA